MEEPEFTTYSVGLVSASVCTRLPLKEATSKLNSQEPTGIPNGWRPSKDKEFATGQPNPCECNRDPRNKHYLFNC